MPRLFNTSRRRLAVPSLLALAAAAAVASPASAAAATHPLFSDPANDAPAATDILAVDISSDGTAVTFTQKLRDADARPPLFAFVPRYTVSLRYGTMLATAYTQFGNGDETRLQYGTDIGGGFIDEDGGTVFGTRTRDSATDTVSFRFAYADFGTGALRDGVVLRDITARATNTQDLFGRVDTAAAAGGFSYTLGQ